MEFNVAKGLRLLAGRAIRSKFEAIAGEILGGRLDAAVEVVRQIEQDYPALRETLAQIKTQSPDEAVNTLAEYWPELASLPGASLLVAQLQSELNRQ